MNKRLDVLLVENGSFESRARAQYAVQKGCVTVNGVTEKNKSAQISETDVVEIDAELAKDSLKFVSRGGIKLENAVADFKISLKDKTVLDVGASTGGFTDCALYYGAKQVYALDVGHGQLAEKLKNDARVTSIENANFRDFTAKDFSNVIDTITVDVSFISLKLLMPNFKNVLKSGGELIALIKPQFECGKEIASKYKGVILSSSTHIAVLRDVINSFNTNGFTLNGLKFSPIIGGSGNIEYLAYFVLDNEKVEGHDSDITKCVSSAFQNFNIR